MAEITLDKCLVNNRYKYQIQLSPLENYQYFHQAISFSRGVEFVTTSNILKKFELIVFDLPGMDCDLKTADLEFKSFYKELNNHINRIINSEENAFNIYASIYDLFKELTEDLNSNTPQNFLAIERILEFPHRELRKRNIPLIKGTRKGAIVQEIQGCKDYNILQFDGLPSNLKNYIFDYIKLGNKHKEKHFSILHKRITWLFNQKEYFKHYQFEGGIADIFEIAIMLHPKIKGFGNREVTLEQFAKDLALILGQSFTRIADQKIHWWDVRLRKVCMSRKR